MALVFYFIMPKSVAEWPNVAILRASFGHPSGLNKFVFVVIFIDFYGYTVY